MNSISSLQNLQKNQFAQLNQLSTDQQPSDQEMTTKEVFQDFVAGTFYKMMLKSLRSTEEENPYFDGGQAEKVFKGQLDQQIAENLAKEQGAQFSDDLFQVYINRFRSAQRNDTSARMGNK